MRVASVEESPKILLGISEVKKRSLTCYHCRGQLPGGGRVPVGWEKLSSGFEHSATHTLPCRVRSTDMYFAQVLENVGCVFPSCDQ